MRMDELRGAFPAMPDATRDALEITLHQLDDGQRQGHPLPTVPMQACLACRTLACGW